MTNEEKAREIANLHKITYIAGLKNERGSSFIECLSSAYQMAQWKDHQFKEYLEKKKEEYISRRDDADMWTEQWAVYHALACTTHQTINELFGGE